jgi:hypothetical protein
VVDIWRGRALKLKNATSAEVATDVRNQGYDLPPPKSVTTDQLERILVQLLLDGYLAGEYQFTAYTTNCYVKLGPKGKLLIQGRGPTVLEMCLPSKKAAKNQKATSTAIIVQRKTPQQSAKKRPIQELSDDDDFDFSTKRTPPVEFNQDVFDESSTCDDFIADASKSKLRSLPSSFSENRTPPKSGNQNDWISALKRRESAKTQVTPMIDLTGDDDEPDMGNDDDWEFRV